VSTHIIPWNVDVEPHPLSLPHKGRTSVRLCGKVCAVVMPMEGDVQNSENRQAREILDTATIHITSLLEFSSKSTLNNVLPLNLWLTKKRSVKQTTIYFI
jgi:hypothetical protein